MRDIKFRAWHHGGGDPRVKGRMNFSEPFTQMFWKCVQDEPLAVEVMQYTGLKDHAGKEIYEGDVLDQSKYPEDDPCPYSVVFEDAAFRKAYPGWSDALPKPVLREQDVRLLDDVVIGNTRENPELAG